MSEERAFLDAIAAEPDDDTARLVYADWLEENDFPDRADAIRRGVKAPKRFTFEEGAVAQIAYTGTRRDLPQIVSVTQATGYAGVRWTTYKGLIESATCTWERWLEVGDGLLLYNWCPEVVLTTTPVIARFATDAVNVYAFRKAAIPGRKWHPFGPGEDATRVVLAAEWPAVKRWAMPERVVSWKGQWPQRGDAVTLTNGARGVLLGDMGEDFTGVVRRIPEARA